MHNTKWERVLPENELCSAIERNNKKYFPLYEIIQPTTFSLVFSFFLQGTDNVAQNKHG